MKNKKLIKTIKLNVINQLKLDIKNSVLKQLLGNYKKEIKKLRKQIYREMQEELFGLKKDSKEKKDNFSGFIHTNNVDKDDFATSSNEIKNKKTSPYEPGKIFEYKGFKFDVNKMSSIVVWKKKSKDDISTTIPSSSMSPMSSMLPAIENLFENEENDIKNNKEDTKSIIEGIKKGNKKDEIRIIISEPNIKASTPPLKYTQGFNVGPGIPNLSSINMVPFSDCFVKTKIEKITPSQKEEISFFVGKLKKGIDNLVNIEKNIIYRKKKDDIYTFSFDKSKLTKDDFSFKFEFDLNMHTYGATVNTFLFAIDGFNFNKDFVEILDIVKVLEATGINLAKYINEINEINTSSNLKKSVKDIKVNTKLEELILDKRILKILQSNDINTYGQLNDIKNFTSINGVGYKTAEKIKKYIKI